MFPQLTQEELDSFDIDYTVAPDNKFRIEISVLPPNPDASWKRTAVPSHGTWNSVRTHILDKMKIPRVEQGSVILSYRLGDLKAMKYGLEDETNWLELCSELKAYLESATTKKRVKSKMPVYVQVASMVSDLEPH